jgi:hypothetical protein
MRALCLLRDSLVYRKDAFCAGLTAAGYTVVNKLPDPRPEDILVIWNRYGPYHEQANFFESRRARVVVTENGHLGKEWRGGNWYSLTTHHNGGAGLYVYGGPERWDNWKVTLAPWKRGKEIIIFGQRGIGEPNHRAPINWAEVTQRKVRGSRIRPHPGNHPAAVSLEDDLANAYACITWHSAAANKALLMGVPVFYDYPSWIGAMAGKPLKALLDGEEPNRNDCDRLEAFRHMAWAMWDLAEIQTGMPFKHLLFHL